MYWKLEVLEYGKIERAEIKVAPLTLFVGDNNSGKSYLMSLLWGIQNFGVEALLGGLEEEPLEEEYVLMKWLKKQIKIAWEKGSCTCKAEEMADIIQLILDIRLRENKENLVKKIFNSPDVKIKELKIRLTAPERISIKIVRDGKTNVRRSFSFESKETGRGGMFHFNEELNNIKVKIDRFMLYTFFSMILDIDIAEGTINYNTYLPSSRTGFLLTKDIINKVGRNTVFNLRFDREKISPFARPVNQFLDVMNDLTTEGKGNDKFNEVTSYLENGMTEGSVQMSTLPNKEVSYIPAGHTAGMPLRVVSAVVTELAPLILILKHKEYLNTLFYEEPEMCLHPQLQRKMAKVICQLVNNGLNMTITTHSDIILQHINNMLRLSGREDRDKICQALGYTSKDWLEAEQVKVYQLKSKPEGKTVVEELRCGENGFAIPTFNDALDKIMDEAYIIQE